MRKEDLKDGMILTNRGQNHEQKVILNGIIYWEDCISNSIKLSTRQLNTYRGDLTSVISPDLDIVKVSYMGETVWERKEYVSFDEARKSGKRIRYCGDFSTEPQETQEFFKQFYPFYKVMEELAVVLWADELNEAIDSKLWEIEK